MKFLTTLSWGSSSRNRKKYCSKASLSTLFKKDWTCKRYYRRYLRKPKKFQPTWRCGRASAVSAPIEAWKAVTNTWSGSSAQRTAWANGANNNNKIWLTFIRGLETNGHWLPDSWEEPPKISGINSDVWSWNHKNNNSIFGSSKI